MKQGSRYHSSIKLPQKSAATLYKLYSSKEILLAVLSFFSRNDLIISVSPVCKRFHELAFSSNSQLHSKITIYRASKVFVAKDIWKFSSLHTLRLSLKGLSLINCVPDAIEYHLRIFHNKLEELEINNIASAEPIVSAICSSQDSSNTTASSARNKSPRLPFPALKVLRLGILDNFFNVWSQLYDKHAIPTAIQELHFYMNTTSSQEDSPTSTSSAPSLRNTDKLLLSLVRLKKAGLLPHLKRVYITGIPIFIGDSFTEHFFHRFATNIKAITLYAKDSSISQGLSLASFQSFVKRAAFISNSLLELEICDLSLKQCSSLPYHHISHLLRLKKLVFRRLEGSNEKEVTNRLFTNIPKTVERFYLIDSSLIYFPNIQHLSRVLTHFTMRNTYCEEKMENWFLLDCTELKRVKFDNCSLTMDTNPLFSKWSRLCSMKLNTRDILNTFSLYPPLRKLSLQYNILATSNFVFPSTLTKLDMSNCFNMTELPKGLTRCLNLEALIVSTKYERPPQHLALRKSPYEEKAEKQQMHLRGGITVIPEFVEQFQFLKTLVLSHSNLTKFPFFLLRLHHLQHLDLSHNFITSLPLELKAYYYLPNLKHLNLMCNKIADNPNSYIFNLRGVEYVDFRSNSFVSKFRKEPAGSFSISMRDSTSKEDISNKITESVFQQLVQQGETLRCSSVNITHFCLDYVIPLISTTPASTSTFSPAPTHRHHSSSSTPSSPIVRPMRWAIAFWYQYHMFSNDHHNNTHLVSVNMITSDLMNPVEKATHYKTEPLVKENGLPKQPGTFRLVKKLEFKYKRLALKKTSFKAVYDPFEHSLGNNL